MDPGTAAGLSLAVIGVAVQCFTGLMSALRLIAAARGLKPEYRFLYSTEARVHSDRWLPRVASGDQHQNFSTPHYVFGCVDPCKSFSSV